MTDHSRRSSSNKVGGELQRIPTPYVLFLGDAIDREAAKTAIGIAHWRPDNCVGQLRLPGCQVDLGLADLDVEGASERGARTLVVGVANRGGEVSPGWIDTLVDAAEQGLHLAAGLHTRLSGFDVITSAALASGVGIHDVRIPPSGLPVGNGVRRSGKRLLTIGTDCSVGKMFTSLQLAREMEARGIPATFRATGQTGILIAGEGIPVDAVVGDFISGSVERLTPEAPEDHWDVVEGQGSLFHPSFAGVSLGLLHGSQPDAMVLCLVPGRPHMRGLPHVPSPDLGQCLSLNEEAARLTNPAARVVGLSANTYGMTPDDAERTLDELERELGLPAVDPVSTGVSRLIDALPK